MRMSHNYQTTRVVWIFHRAIFIIVLRTVDVMHLAHRAFEVFDHPDLDLTRFVEQRIFLEWDQFLVSWSCGIDPRLA
jgi:hypothetical protein